MKTIQEQFTFLAELKGLDEKRLRKLHKDTFKGTKWWVKVPLWMHRSMVERRLFYYFCAKNYHMPSDHPFTKEFRRKALHILSKEYLQSIDSNEYARQRIRELEQFSAANVRAMNMVEVDRYLASLGLFIESDDMSRRKALYEWFNHQSKDLIKHQNHDGKMVRAHRKGTLNNKFYLRDLILENPTLCYSDFRDRFAEQMPTVTRMSYNVARCLLRKAGYDIPKLKAGPTNPTVRRGQYGIQKSRTLNRTIEEIEF